MKNLHFVIFWLVISFLVIGIGVVGFGIYLYVIGDGGIQANLTTSYLIGTFTLLTPILSKIFIKKITIFEQKGKESPKYLKSFVNNLENYEKEILTYFSSNSTVATIESSDATESAVIYEANLHIFSFFWQTLALIGLIIYATIVNHNYLFVLFLPILVLAITIYQMTAKTNEEYKKYFVICNKEIHDKYNSRFLKFIAIQLPPIRSVITCGRFIMLALNIILTISLYLHLRG